jgi:5-formyltetrahydrofolate cyclo-ligase
MVTVNNRAKDEVRTDVWRRMDAADAGRSGSVHGKIPDFVGAETAAQRLATLEQWRGAAVIKANPDKAQAEVRSNVLDTGRLLYMAVPRLASFEPFYQLDPRTLAAPVRHVITSAGAAEHAPRVQVEEMRPVDVVVCGSVAVNRAGVRIGKGAGYSDIEIALLKDAGLLGPETLIVTTVHPLQVVDEPLPESRHDARLDVIVTPEETIFCTSPREPVGIVWTDLSEDKIKSIPALAARTARRG